MAWAWAYDHKMNIYSVSMNTLISNRSRTCQYSISTYTEHTMKWANSLLSKACSFEQNQWSMRSHFHSSMSPIANEIEVISFVFTFCSMVESVCDSIFTKAWVLKCVSSVPIDLQSWCRHWLTIYLENVVVIPLLCLLILVFVSNLFGFHACRVSMSVGRKMFRMKSTARRT